MSTQPLSSTRRALRRDTLRPNAIWGIFLSLFFSFVRFCVSFFLCFLFLFFADFYLFLSKILFLSFFSPFIFHFPFFSLFFFSSFFCFFCYFFFSHCLVILKAVSMRKETGISPKTFQGRDFSMKRPHNRVTLSHNTTWLFSMRPAREVLKTSRGQDSSSAIQLPRGSHLLCVP